MKIELESGTKLKIPDEIYTLTDDMKIVMSFISHLTNNSSFEDFANTWFYDANKLPIDEPDFDLSLLAKRKIIGLIDGIIRYE